ncbi:hypothetical protein M1247_11925 [Mycobacterium sp. 21AC1]|uniref:hypothetical protein n=1 Tax=[Mycobacterium] appelbergii TaxID=2939269 RepID=UPI002939205E|nr:hypothetical protein [Mycobacterium sp. 21AC1]MDV3125624.1 hypothetical protein [Mycobacterium sp. 21AC1]
MRNEIVAGIGGLVVGHILWLAAISFATDAVKVNEWVLVVAAASFVLGVVGGVLGWRRAQQKSYVWAAFLWCLPVSPVLFSVGVLGVTYL